MEMARVYRESGTRHRSAQRDRRRGRADALVARPATPVIALGDRPSGEISRPGRAGDGRAPGAARAPCRSHGSRGDDHRAAERSERRRRLPASDRESACVSVQVTTLPSGLAVVTDATAHVKTAALGVFVGRRARATRARQSTGFPICSSTWRSKARADEAPARSPRRSRTWAAISTPRPASSAPAISPASWARTSALALDILGDILTDSQFDADELEREKNVIVQEIGAVEDTPDDLIFDLLTASAWPDQAIGRPILGTRERVGAFDRIAIDGYLRKHYSAPATVVAAAGAVAARRHRRARGGQP